MVSSRMVLFFLTSSGCLIFMLKASIQFLSAEDISLCLFLKIYGLKRVTAFQGEEKAFYSTTKKLSMENQLEGNIGFLPERESSSENLDLESLSLEERV
jgi:hypothetical protein